MASWVHHTGKCLQWFGKEGKFWEAERLGESEEAGGFGGYNRNIFYVNFFNAVARDSYSG
jgi:hypothetical protein